MEGISPLGANFSSLLGQRKKELVQMPPLPFLSFVFSYNLLLSKKYRIDFFPAIISLVPLARALKILLISFHSLSKSSAITGHSPLITEMLPSLTYHLFPSCACPNL